MKTLRITNGFERMSDAVLLVRTNSIITSLSGNPVFPTPAPTLNEMMGVYNAFQAAVLKAEGGDRLAIAERNAKREVLINHLHLLGNYVLFTSAGDEVKAKSSDFSIAKSATTQPPLNIPEGLQLTNGVNKGELKLRFKTVKGARGYRYEITPSPITNGSVWEESIDTVTKKQYSGLESGKEYNVRVAAYGIKAQIVYSNVVSRVAL